MNVLRVPHGHSLIEVLLALGLFVLFVAGGATATVGYLRTTSRADTLLNARAILEESFEATQAVADINWTALADGTYGLTDVSGTWELTATPDVVNGRYTRTITIATAARDGDCLLVASGGTPDADTKQVTATVAWAENGIVRNQAAQHHLARWKNVTACSGGDEGGQAATMTIHVTNAIIDATKKSLNGVTIVNTGTATSTIDTMTLTWTKPGNIEFIKIDGTNHWHKNGTGSPMGAQPSGTVLDLVDFLMSPGVTYSVDAFRFGDKVDGSTFTITATMSDGTSQTVVTTPPFVP